MNASYARFTDKAKRAMDRAEYEAQRLKQADVGTGHILLGLINEGPCVAIVAIENLAGDPKSIREATERAAIENAHNEITEATTSKVIEDAREESRSLEHNYIGTEHILLGLLRVSDCVAAQVLTTFGLNLQNVRAEVIKLLA